MADEIKVLSMSRDGGKVTALFFYPIPVAQRINDPLTSSPFVHSPTADMDDSWTALLSVGEQAALNAGEALVVTQSQGVPDGATSAELVAALRERYASRPASILAAYQDVYEHKNKQFDSEA